MGATAIVFYVLSAVMLTAGILAVTTKKIFRAAIWLLFSLIAIAGLYFWMQMEFIAAVQVAVYVGGIVVLIIFSVFLTQRSGKEMQKPALSNTIFSALAVLAGLGMTCLIISRYTFRPASQPAIDHGVSTIGMQMLSTTDYGYVFPFEVVSILLLAALVGCIVIAGKAEQIN